MIRDIINEILKKEGGFVNHKDDRGGPTNYGITLDTLSQYLGFAVTINGLKTMHQVVAYNIYHEQYFIKPRINLLPQSLQAIILDMAVNHGPKNAIKMLQNSLKTLGIAVAVDGLMGQNTAAAASKAINQYGLTPTQNNIVDIRVQFYERIVANDDSQRVFLNGWVKRAESFRMGPS